MEIVKEISVTLSPIEVKEIIKQYLKQEKGIDIKTINFNIDAVYDDGDWRGEYPPSHDLGKVICSGVVENYKAEI